MVPEFPGGCHDQRWGADGGFSFLHLTWFLLPRCTPSDAVWSALCIILSGPSMHQISHASGYWVYVGLFYVDVIGRLHP